MPSKYVPTGKPPGRPRKQENPMTEGTEKPAATPAVQMISVEAAEKQMRELAASLTADFAKKLEVIGATVPVNQPSDLTALGPVFEKLGMQIAELTDQNAQVQIRRLPPAEIAARAAAFEHMGELLSAIQAKPASEWPIYSLVAKTQLNGKDGPRIVDPIISIGKNEWEQVRIRHAGQPNLAMRPYNDAAKAVYKQYIRHLGGSEAANKIAPQSPAWMTFDGTHVIAGAGNNSTRAHGREFTVDPIDIDGEDVAVARARNMSELTEEMLVPNDPRRKEIHVLGTLSPAATTGSTSARTV
jgi:hypothetical protein